MRAPETSDPYRLVDEPNDVPGSSITTAFHFDDYVGDLELDTEQQMKTDLDECVLPHTSTPTSQPFFHLVGQTR